MIYLKQSTASQEIFLGVFVDQTDGFTAETALSIANTDIKIGKAGATTLADKNSGGATHISGGIYSAVLDATDTNTLGSGMIFCHVAGARPVMVPFTVLTAVNYDAFIAGTDNFDVSVTQWTGTAVATPDTAGYPKVTIKDGTGTGELDTTSGGVLVASIAANAITATSIASDAITDAKVASDVTIASVTGAVGSVTGAVGSVAAGGITASSIATDALGALELSADAVTEIVAGVWNAARATYNATGSFGESYSAIISGSVTGAATNVSLIDSALTASDTGHYIGRTVVFITGSLAGQATTINGFNATLDRITFETLTGIPATSDRYVIV